MAIMQMLAALKAAGAGNTVGNPILGYDPQGTPVSDPRMGTPMDSEMAGPMSSAPATPPMFNNLGDVISYARSQDPYVTAFADAGAKRKTAAAMFNDAASMSPPKMPDYPVRPGEAGLLGLGAIIASALGAPSADINAFVGNYMGAKSGAQKSQFEQQMTLHQQKQQAKQNEAKIMLDSAQGDEEKAKFLATMEERKQMAKDREDAKKEMSNRVEIGKYLDKMNSKKQDSKKRMIPISPEEFKRNIDSIKALDPNYFLDPATKQDTSESLIAAHQDEIDRYTAMNIVDSNIDTALNKTGTDKWQRVGAASTILQAMKDPRYADTIRTMVNPEALKMVDQEASWEKYRNQLSAQSKAAIDRMEKRNEVDDATLEKMAQDLIILKNWGGKTAEAKYLNLLETKKKLAAQVKDIQDGKKDAKSLDPGNITSAIRGNTDLIARFMTAKAEIVKSSSYSQYIDEKDPSKGMTDQGNTVAYIDAKIKEYMDENKRLQDVRGTMLGLPKDLQPGGANPGGPKLDSYGQTYEQALAKVKANLSKMTPQLRKEARDHLMKYFGKNGGI